MTGPKSPRRAGTRLTERVQVLALELLAEALDVESLVLLAAVGALAATPARTWSPARRAAHGRRMRRVWQELQALDPTAHPGPRGKASSGEGAKGRATGPRRLTGVR